ncbi:unnamed protein product [Euphydryas editha]|uniref:Uncharacterized protein n=1 Tax=Euphydryas editha TaxID=104508 RepID=A0AAU9URM7_EUPED|nr:unnamed protein product [Euphydryas editha]
MRLALLNDLSADDFSKQLLTIGNGRVPVDESSGLISFPPNFCNFVSSKDKLINKVFPDIIADHKNTKSIVGTLYSFKSIDCVTNEDEATNYPTEFLNSLDYHRTIYN